MFILFPLKWLFLKRNQNGLKVGVFLQIGTLRNWSLEMNPFLCAVVDPGGRFTMLQIEISKKESAHLSAKTEESHGAKPGKRDCHKAPAWQETDEWDWRCEGKWHYSTIQALKAEIWAPETGCSWARYFCLYSRGLRVQAIVFSTILLFFRFRWWIILSVFYIFYNYITL